LHSAYSHAIDIAMRYIDKRLTELGARPDEQGQVFEARQSALGLSRENYARDYARLRRKTAKGRSQVARANLKAVHGMALERYAELYEAQAARCAICSRPISMSYNAAPSAQGAPGQACVDHDHACCPGRRSCGSCIRGLLCRHCSAGLARFRDNPELLRFAADYVTRAV
jgi:Recombination endonuclease VII